jgi:hypothetical protein
VGWLPWEWRSAPFWKACERHDFGYRNYKEQRRFNAETKESIDDHFQHDLALYICDPMGSPYANECHALVNNYYKVVSLFPPYDEPWE